MAFVIWIVLSFIVGGVVGFIGFRANSRDSDATYGEPDPTQGRGGDVFGRR